MKAVYLPRFFCKNTKIRTYAGQYLTFFGESISRPVLTKVQSNKSSSGIKWNGLRQNNKEM